MLKRLFKRKAKSDRGGSELISFILLVPLFLGLIVTAVDVSFYFSNRGQVESIARDAARTVAIFGGSGDHQKATSIEKKYGTSRASACSPTRADVMNAPNKYIFSDAKKSTMSAVECNVLAALANANGLVSVASKTPVKVNCGPNETKSVGSRTYCTIEYTYSSMPGAPMSFIQMRQDDGSASGMLSKNVVTKSSESEVKLPGLVSR